MEREPTDKEALQFLGSKMIDMQSLVTILNVLLLTLLANMPDEERRRFFESAQRTLDQHLGASQMLYRAEIGNRPERARTQRFDILDNLKRYFAFFEKPSSPPS